MENRKICTYDQLQIQIATLRNEKSYLEEDLKHSFFTFIATLNPLSFVKNSLHTLATDTEVQFDLAKVGLNIGANLIIGQVFGKYRSIKGFFRSVLAENVSSYFINSNAGKIVSVIGRQISERLHPDNRINKKNHY